MCDKLLDWFSAKRSRVVWAFVCLVAVMFYLSSEPWKERLTIEEQVNAVLYLGADEGQLCEGFNCEYQFREYVYYMSGRLGEPYKIIPGGLPFNEGAVYVYWKLGDESFDLKLRHVSDYWRNQRLRPKITYLRRAWAEP